MRDDELRIRLEGGAELLEETHQRYRTLVSSLKGLRWKEGLRRNVEVLREVVRVQAQVDDTLARVQRRREAEAWPDSPLVRLFSETTSLRAELQQRVTARLGETLQLGAGLSALEARVVFAPRLVLPGSRWAVACEVLPTTEAFVQHSQRFGAHLQRLFAGRDDAPVNATDDELAAFAREWPGGLHALDQALERLDRVDLTGGVRRSLLRRARRPPSGPPEPTGAEVVVHALHWRDAALAHVQRVVAARLEPARVEAHERLAVYLWLARRGRTGEPLDLGPGRRPRAALLELAALLRGQLGGAPNRDAFGSLRTLATEADGAPSDPDWKRVLESLKLVMRVMAAPAAFLPPVHREKAPGPRRLDVATNLSSCLDAIETQLDRGRQ